MDSPNPPDAKTIPFQYLLCPPLEHQDMLSTHSSDQVAEQLLTLKEAFQPLFGGNKELMQPSSRIELQAAGILRLYSMLWETYNAKKAESQRLEKENEVIRIANINLLEQQALLERRHADQESLITYYGQVFDKVREGMADVIRDWEGPPTEDTIESGEEITEEASWNA
ncbi:hypothetical protein CBS147333_10098 [Penicillium roqueforti]|nr:hypothetical protein CBS147333_10098 [Penicillium roqueforti]KAI3188403.1 hypothetical protein CBS147311_10079 [Penicillium roqueforti]KAI3261077.1 hypothetical protein CBS147308_10073 [Penicillium roqueforti]KAI3277371.1 hypothetical protein DTO003C3_10114 [Penicillium roqueforti]